MLGCYGLGVNQADLICGQTNQIQLVDLVQFIVPFNYRNFTLKIESWSI